MTMVCSHCIRLLCGLWSDVCCGVWRSCLFEEREKQQCERVVITVMIWPLWTRSEKMWTGWISLKVMHEWWRIVYVVSMSDFVVCWSSLSRNKNFNSCEFLWISLAALVRKIWINEARGKIDEDSTVLWVFEGRWCDRKHHFISGYEELAIGLGRGCSWCFKRLQLLFWLFFFI